MRALILALLVCLPLAAGEESVLDRAVEGFRNDNPDLRDASSHLAETYLRDVLAPLLASFDDSEPEVRRRALESIVNLLPPDYLPKSEADEEEQQQDTVVFFRKGKKGGKFVFQIVNGRLQIQPPPEKKALNIERDLGIQTDLLTRILRKQLRLADGQGLAITSVRPRSRAAIYGLQPFDILLRADGKIIKSPKELAEVLGPKPDWTKVALRVLREGKPLDLEPKPKNTLKAPAPR